MPTKFTPRRFWDSKKNKTLISVRYQNYSGEDKFIVMPERSFMNALKKAQEIQKHFDLNKHKLKRVM